MTSVSTRLGVQSHPRSPEPFRLVGRPFDPRERASSRGEQRTEVADRLIYSGSGVLGALTALYVIARKVLG